jgi:peptidoglycan hydrolase-like protein with peptidoglycan-binding domain
MPLDLQLPDGFVLRRGDSDATKVYGGKHRPEQTQSWVANLQEGLFAFGLAFADWSSAANRGRFDRKTEWAVREFQAYARMASVANAGGSPVANAHRVELPPHGVVDAPTRDALRGWAQDDYRVPVSIAAFNSDTDQPAPGTEVTIPPFSGLVPLGDPANLWNHDAVRIPRPTPQNPGPRVPRVFARDVSGYYTSDGASTARDLSLFQSLGFSARYQGRFGPNTTSGQAWREATEVLPARLGLPAVGTWSDELLRTFKVVHAIGQVENEDYFDVVNSYDAGILSFGLYQWTLQFELPAALAYLKRVAPALYGKAFGRFGLDATVDWPSIAGAASGAGPFVPDERKYVSAVTLPAPDGVGEPFDMGAGDDRHYLHNWHWHYRFAMAARSIEDVRKFQWDLARLRIRDLFSVPWPAGAFPTAGGVPATIGQTFRSERSVAMLVRWHVVFPAGVVLNGVVGTGLRRVWDTVRTAAPFNVADGANTATWTTPEHERRLTEAMVQVFQATPALVNDLTLQKLRGWHSLPGYTLDLGARLPAPVSIDLQEPQLATVAADLRAVPEGNAFHPVPASVSAALAALDDPIPLGGSSRISHRQHHTRWILEQFVADREPQVFGRRFNLGLNNAATTLTVTETPTLSLERVPQNTEFLDVGGLAPPVLGASLGPLDASFEEELEDSGSGTAVSTELRDALVQLLRLGLPATSVPDPVAPAARVEEPGGRWQVSWRAGGPVEFVTIRKVGDALRIDPPGTSMRYGGLVLRFGSGDVAGLRADLIALGFRGVGPSGAFNEDVRVAVREFQAYARDPFVARVRAVVPDGSSYAQSLERAANPQPYTGSVSGVVDNQTRALIDLWVSERNRFRCPVVVEAREPDAAGPLDGDDLQNLWLRARDADPTHRMFVTDHRTGPGAVAVPLGVFSGGADGGPRVENTAGFAPAQREVTRAAFGAPDEARPTFRALRAVSERTCAGFLDGADASDPDRAVTLGFSDLRDRLPTADGLDPQWAGGLGGLFALVRDDHAGAFRAAVGRYGLRAAKPWHTPNTQPDGSASPDGNLLLDQSTRRYRGRLAFQGERFAFDDVVGGGDGPRLRSWHWVYRLRQAGRDPAFARGVWDLARLQLRALSRTVVKITGVEQKPLGQFATSEKVWAVLWYWHLRFPRDVAALQQVGPEVARAIRDAGLTSVPSDNAQQRALVAELLERAAASRGEDFRSELLAVARWPEWVNAATENPRGFTLPDDEQALSSTITTNVDAIATGLNGGTPTVHADLRAVLTALVDDASWDTATVNVRRVGTTVWRLDREAPDDHQAFWVKRSGDTLGVFAGLSPRHADPFPLVDGDAFPVFDAELPPDPANASGLAALISLSAPQTLSGDRFRFGLGLASLLDPLNGMRTVTHVVVHRPDVPALKIPLRAAQPVPDDLEPTGDALDLVDAPGGEPTPWSVTHFGPDVSLPAIDWELDLRSLFSPSGAMAPSGTLHLADLVREDTGEYTGRMHLELAAGFGFLDRPLRLTFAAAGNDEDVNRTLFDLFTVADDRLQFPLTPDPANPLSGLPLALPDAMTLVAGAGGDGVEGVLAGDLDRPRLDLGSPLVRLNFDQPIRVALDSLSGLRLLLAEGEPSALPRLSMDVFSESVNDQKVINHLWAALPGAGDLDRLFSLHPPDASGIEWPEGAPLVVWRDRGPLLDVRLLEGLTDLRVNAFRRLRSFAGDVLGAAAPALTTFERGSGPVRFGPGDDGTWRLVVPLKLVLKAEGGELPDPDAVIFAAEGEFGFIAEADDATDLTAVRLQAGAFRVDPEVTLVVTSDEFAKGFAFGDLISLHVPRDIVFRLRTDPRSPALSWDRPQTLARTRGRVLLRVPASARQSDNLNDPEAKRFTFELEEFRLQSRGFDCRGAVRAENVPFNDDDGDEEDQLTSGFQAPLSTRRPEADGAAPGEGGEPPLGTIAFENSRLVHGSLTAGFQLRWFDDAQGTITFLMSEDRETRRLSIVGTVSVSGLVEYRIAELFALFQLRKLDLETRFTKDGDAITWRSEGRMTGAVKFEPAPGQSPSGALAPLAELFSGITCAFEDLNPVRIGHGERVTFSFPAKTFTVANILELDLQGIEVGGTARAADKQFGLLGEVRIKNLPGIPVTLTFGGIDLTTTGAGFPRITIKRIGASVAVPGGFEAEAVLDYIDNELERGFGGTVRLKTEALPKLTGLLKLTEARAAEERGFVPSVALFLEAPFEPPLGYGFYLRSVGAGLGINQALRGLGREQQNLPIERRIRDFVDDPRGLPSPRVVDSWEPNPPARVSRPPSWMLVAQGLITFAKLDRDTAHVLAASLLVALDQNLRLVAGVNLWLFASPDETDLPEFQQRPAARGAIEISPREGKIFGYFRTLPNPRLGRDAPELLGQVLSVVQTSLMFLADRNGFLFEVGWPWDTRVQLPLPAPLRGELTTGYRYGIYRGVICYGLNYGIDVGFDAQAGIDFNTPLGSAGARLVVRGQGYFRSSFVGALDPAFRPFLLGDVRVAATVNVQAEAHCELSRKISRWFKIRLRIRFSASFNLTINAALTAGFDQGGLGFDGEAHVSVSVSGYRIAGQVPFKFNQDKIVSVRGRLDQILPPAIFPQFRALGFGPHPGFRTARAIPPEGRPWQYRYRRRGSEVIVLLVPAPGVDYNGVGVADPDVDDLPEPTDPRFVLPLTPDGAARYRRFLCDDPNDFNPLRGDALEWGEDYAAILMTAAEIRSSSERVGDTDDEEPPLGAEPKDLTVLRMLVGLYEAQHGGGTPESGFLFAGDEVADPRVRRPSAADADDNTAGQPASARHSPYFKRDQPYDEATSVACAPGRPAPAADDAQIEGLSSGMIAAELLALFRDERAAETGDPGLALLAPRLRTILVFDASGLPDPDDPVPALIDLDGSITLAGEPATLVPVVPEEPREYDLVPGHVFQSDGEIALAWDFRFEDQREDEPFTAPYQEGFEAFVVTRTNLTRPKAAPRVETLGAVCWLDPGDGRLVRPPFQYVDSRLAPDDGVEDNDLLEYRIDAIGQDGPERPLSSTIVTVVRQRASALPPPDAAVALHRPAAVTVTTADGVFDDDGGHLELFVGRAVALELRLVPALTDPSGIPAEGKNLLVVAAVNGSLYLRVFDADGSPVVDTDEGALGDQAGPVDDLKRRLESLRPPHILTAAEEGGLIVAVLAILARAPGAPGSGNPVLDFFAPGELSVRFRLVPAAPFGAYGTEQDATGGAVRSQSGLPPAATLGRDDLTRVRFGESPSTRPLPWEEMLAVQGIGWQAHVVADGGEPAFTGFRARIAVAGLRAALERAAGRALAPDQAVELWVGRDRAADEQRPRAASVLRPFRHAIVLPAAAGEEPVPAAIEDRKDFGLGNPVRAIEFLPRSPSAAAARDLYLDPAFVAAAVDYGDEVGADPVRIVLRWRMPPESGDVFNPVVGFRVHRLDRFNPITYRPGPQGIAPRLEHALRVLPAIVYQSLPSTIELRPVALQDPATGRTEVRGDWVPGLDGCEQWPPVPRDIDPHDLVYRDDPERRGNSFIHELLMEFLDRLCRLINDLKRADPDEFVAAFSLSIPDALEDRADALAGQDRGPDPRAAAARVQRLGAAFEAFQAAHGAGADPYAWGVADALGLGAEVTLFNGITGEPISLHELIAEHALFDELRRIEGVAFQPQVQMAVFLAEDGVTHLNVFRVVYAPDWPGWGEHRDFDLGAALILKVLGRDPGLVRNGVPVPWPYSDELFDVTEDRINPAPARAVREASDRLKRAVSDWVLDDVNPRLRVGLGLPAQPVRSRVTLYRHDLTAAGQAVRPPAAPRLLPVDRAGVAALTLDVPDRLAHLYDLALELERRYDTVWARLRPQPAPEPAPIPYERLRPVEVDRTRPLVPHNVLATPLAGSVQAYVFAHPAEFAATASAVNAVSVQYSGQTVSLERRIPLLDRVADIFTDRDEYDVEWDRYQQWLDANGYERRFAGPGLDLRPVGEHTDLALRPVAGSQSGLYGVDRYVYPDLPAYYEYRVAAQSTAGRAQSPIALTAFVSPLHDEARRERVTGDDGPSTVVVRPARQQPRTEGVGRASYDPDSQSLTLELRLVHPRLHLRPELAGLWVASDDEIDLPGEVAVRFGSLPDLWLRYQVYIIYNAGAAGETPVLTPILEVTPPLAPERDQDARAFRGRSQDKDVDLVHRDDDSLRDAEQDLRVVQRLPGIVAEPAHDHELFLRARLDLTRAAFVRDLIERTLGRGADLRSLFEVSVNRAGANSLIGPLVADPAE